MCDEMTFGLYIREQRNRKRWSLGRLAEETGLSYSHLSRIENDSAEPKVETVVALAGALSGDLKRMLDLSQCLPQQILDQIAVAAKPTSSLKRAAHRRPIDTDLRAKAKQLAVALGMKASEAEGASEGLLRFLSLSEPQRNALLVLVESFEEASDETT